MLLMVLLSLAALCTVITALGVFASWKMAQAKDNDPTFAVGMTVFFFAASVVLWLVWAEKYDHAVEVAKYRQTLQAEANK